MKKYITALIVAVGLFGCGTTQYKQAQLPEIAWRDMCSLLETESVVYQCMRVMPPNVVYEEMRDGLYGYYDGSDTVFINKDLSQRDKLRTLIHEDIHYLHTQLQIIVIPGPAVQVCWSENEAWTLEGIYSGHDNSNWWTSYPHCWEWYATDQYLRELGALYNAVNDLVEDIIIIETPGE